MTGGCQDIAGPVRVIAGSRLHAGFYYAAGDWSVRWGSAGFYVEEPALEAEFDVAESPCYELSLIHI